MWFPAAVPVLVAALTGVLSARQAQTRFSIEQVMSYPFPDALVVAKAGKRVADRKSVV